MNRLQKKCLIMSIAFHSGLVLILVFGSALMPRPADSDLGFKPIHLYSANQVTDALKTGGGGAEIRLAAPPPAPPEEPNTPVAEPADTSPQPKPPVKATEKPASKPDSKPPEKNSFLDFFKRHDSPKIPDKPHIEESEKPDKEKKPTDPISKDELKLVRRKPGTGDAQSEKDAKLKAAASSAARNRAAKQIAGILHNLDSGLSGEAVVQMPPGFGGEGEASANYRDIIASKYYNAWLPPTSLEDTTPVVTVRVTIMSDGTVKTARIITPSGSRAMDQSIQNALDNVTYIAPFPASSHDAERTVTIQFNLQAKRQLG
jgi:TonB family protein